MEKPYKDRQSFKDPAVTRLLLIVLVLSLSIVVYVSYLSGEISIPIIITGVAFALVYLLMRSLALYVSIDNQGVSYRFVPFHFKDRQILWSEIQSCKVIEVAALNDFGGVGIRYNFNKWGMIMNSGPAIEITRTNEKILVITVSSANQARLAINTFGKKLD